MGVSFHLVEAYCRSFWRRPPRKQACGIYHDSRALAFYIAHKLHIENSSHLGLSYWFLSIPSHLAQLYPVVPFGHQLHSFFVMESKAMGRPLTLNFNCWTPGQSGQKEHGGRRGEWYTHWPFCGLFAAVEEVVFLKHSYLRWLYLKGDIYMFQRKW